MDVWHHIATHPRWRGLGTAAGLCRARLAGQAGQSTTEWLMIAGALSAIGIFLLGLLPFTIRDFCQALVWSLRTVAS